jgi:polysaccharide export outer membrane protein
VDRKALLLILPMLLAGPALLAQAPPETAMTPPAPAQAQEEVLTAKPVPAGEVPIPTQSLLRPGGSDYKVGRQDLLEIKVFDLDELSQTVRVADDGSITVPLLGRLQVAGLTKGELESLIARLLEERFVRDPQVTIFVKEYESKKVAVSGAVKKPGTYEMLGEKTLLEMISQAGGLDVEPGKQIYIFRQANDGGTAERLAVDLDRLVYRADASLNVALAPGDIVYVPAIEKVRIFVSGAVRNPNLYEVPRDEPVTVLKAVTLAGGTTDRAAEKKVQVIRTRPDGTREILPVDLRRVKRGKAEDPVLQRDDLVLVPEAFF